VLDVVDAVDVVGGGGKSEESVHEREMERWREEQTFYGEDRKLLQRSQRFPASSPPYLVFNAWRTG
jgi:hypothetical protein